MTQATAATAIAETVANEPFTAHRMRALAVRAQNQRDQVEAEHLSKVYASIKKDLAALDIVKLRKAIETRSIAGSSIISRETKKTVFTRPLIDTAFKEVPAGKDRDKILAEIVMPWIRDVLCDGEVNHGFEATSNGWILMLKW